MVKRRINSMRGFSLVETMVSVAMGAFILLGVVSATTGLLKGDTTAAARLDNELRSAAFLLQRDVARAGYWADAADKLAKGADEYDNPFKHLDVSAENCITYSYDRNSNGVLDMAGTDERYAIALANETLYFRGGGEDYDCNVSEGEWHPLTDPSVVRITSFTVAVAEASTPIKGKEKSVRTRDVTYKISGELARATKPVGLTLQGTIRLQNDIID